MNLCIKVMLGEISKLCLLVATLALGPGEASGLCEQGRSWWDRERGACVPCTRCEPPHVAARLPCMPHRDAVCQPLHELRFYTDTYDDSEYYDYADDGEVSDDKSDDKNDVKWDLQATTLAVSASGCVVFFVVVLYLTFYHLKQWKVLKQALRADVQNLSAKLKLIESGEAPAEPVESPADHIYCNIHVAKDALIGSASTKGLGNVYTQEKHSS